MTTSDPVAGATHDPRVAELLDILEGFCDEDRIRFVILERLDRADAAAGIRRVPADDIATSVKLAENKVHHLWRMVNAYDGELLCPRCGNGYPGCTDGFPHAETCARYRYGRETCADCDAQMAAESAPVGGAS